MTIIIGQRQHDRILLLSDTKIVNSGETGPNVIPGRLKAVVLGHGLTLAFAGNADAANVVVRRAREVLIASGVEASIELLRSSTSDGHTDYIVASHRPSVRMLLIRRGGLMDVSDICAIGDTAPFSDLIEQSRNTTDDIFKGNLRVRFFDRLLTGRDLGDSVGGFPVAVGATGVSHRYLGHSGFYTFKFPELKWGEETHQSIESVYTGDGHFALGVMPPDQEDVPVFGAYSLQARMGYVYSPLEQPEAFCVRLWPSDRPWEGHEEEMFDTLKRSLAHHVAAVTK